MWLLCLIETEQQGPWGVVVDGRHLDIGASASGWRHGPWPSVLGNRPSEAGGQGVTGWPDTGRVLQPGCEEWLHRPSVNTSHRAGQSRHVLGWMEGEGAEAATRQRPTRATRQGSEYGMRIPTLGAGVLPRGQALCSLVWGSHRRTGIW